MESLSKILSELYPHNKVISEPLHLNDGSLFIVVNAINSNDERISGQLFQVFEYVFGNHYQEISFKHKFVSIQIQTLDNSLLIGILDTGQKVEISYNNCAKHFEINLHE